MSDDFTAFANARLDEDQTAAEATSPVTERRDWQPASKTSPIGGMARNHLVVASDGRIVAEAWPLEDNRASAVTPHIALHDPARVLREVEAKRRRLALYLDAKETLAAALRKAPPEDDPATAHSYVRERINVNQASGRFTALEISVRLDMTIYSGHPDYREEWKP